MDNDVVSAKLELLARSIERVQKRRVGSAAELANDPDTQDIVVLNLQRAVQLCVDIGTHLLSEQSARVPRTMAEVFDALGDQGIINKDLAKRMSRAVGFRNIAVHEYEEIDWNMVYSIVTKGITDFQRFAGAIQALMRKPE